MSLQLCLTHEQDRQVQSYFADNQINSINNRAVVV